MERHAAAEHAQDIGSRADGALGGFLADLGGAGALPRAESAVIRSSRSPASRANSGRGEVADASGETASVPAGLLAELVVGAVPERS